jgi:hypothetical protein
MNGEEDYVDHDGNVAPGRPVGSSHDIVNLRQQQQQQEEVEPSSRKRKLAQVLADPFARLAACSSAAADGTKTTDGDSSGGGGDSKSGRGSHAGWTCCPLCFPLSKKMFARYVRYLFYFCRTCLDLT